MAGSQVPDTGRLIPIGSVGAEGPARSAGAAVAERPAVPTVTVEPDDSRTDLAISRALRLGVLVSTLLVAGGLVAALVSLYAGGARPTIAETLAAAGDGNATLRTPADVLRGLAQGQPYAAVDLGLLVLLATPVLSVALSAASYLRRRDRAFSLITLFVLAVLTASFFLGERG